MNTYGEAPTDIAHEHYLRGGLTPIVDKDLSSPSEWTFVQENSQSPRQSPSKMARLDPLQDKHEDDDDDISDAAPDLGTVLDYEAEDSSFYRTRTMLFKSLKGSKFPTSQLPTHLDGPLSFWVVV